MRLRFFAGNLYMQNTNKFKNNPTMKIIKQLFTLAAIALLITSCNKTEEFAPESNSTFPTDGIIRVATSVSTPKTRGGMTTEYLDEFQMRIVNENNSAYSYYADMIKEDGEWKSFKSADYPLLTPLTMLWQNKTEKIKVAAVSISDYISEQEWDEGILFSIDPDQDFDDYLKMSDFLYMKEKEIDPATDLVKGKIQVALKHRFSKLNLTVKMGTEFNKIDGGTTSNIIDEIFVANTYTAATWKIIEDNISDYSARENIALWTNTEGYIAGSGDTTQAEAKYECILIPQTVAVNDFEVLLYLNDRIFSWTSPAEVVLAGGTQYDLTLTVGQDVVTVGGFTSIPWTVETPQDIETD